MLSAQIPMTVADAAGAGAGLELVAAGGEERLGETRERCSSVGELTIGRQRQQRVRVLGERGVERSGRALRVRQGRSGVELGEAAADRLELATADAAARDERRAASRVSSNRRISTTWSMASGSPAGASVAPPSGVATTARTPRYRS